MSELRLLGARRGEPLQSISPQDWDPGIIPSEARGRPPYPGVEVPRATLVNVANLYRQLGSAVRGEQADYPSFATGLSLHRILEAIETGSDSGVRQHFSAG